MIFYIFESWFGPLLVLAASFPPLGPGLDDDAADLIVGEDDELPCLLQWVGEGEALVTVFLELGPGAPKPAVLVPNPVFLDDGVVPCFSERVGEALGEVKVVVYFFFKLSLLEILFVRGLTPSTEELSSPNFVPKC